MNKENRWTYYFLLALIIVIFGLVIYLTVLGENKSDKYYYTIIFSAKDQTGGDIRYPDNDTSGTLEGVVKEVANYAGYYFSSNINVPDWSRWTMNIIPDINPANGNITNVFYHFSFPINQSQFRSPDMTGRMSDISNGTLTLGDIFNTDESLTWAQTFFADPVSGTITYGDRSSISVAV